MHFKRAKNEAKRIKPCDKELRKPFWLEDFYKTLSNPTKLLVELVVHRLASFMITSKTRYVTLILGSQMLYQKSTDQLSAVHEQNERD